jgi:hypothetical protein
MTVQHQTLGTELEFAKLSVLEKLGKIEEALKTDDPLIAVHCENVRKALQEHEELVHILPDSAIHQFMAGMQKWKQKKIVQETVSSPRGRKKVGADDL